MLTNFAPLSRSERADAFVYKHQKWLAGMQPLTAATIRAIASQFQKGVTDGLENREVSRTPEVVDAGGLDALKKEGKPAELLKETKVRMFSA